MNRVIISDTSCLIALEKIHSLDILKNLYDEIIITPEVNSTLTH
jgi:predicted nucleic acid-binding protein